jgi:hypothetical protein
MKVTIKGHITHTKYAWDDEATFSFYTFDASDEHTVNVMEYEFEVEVPDDFDPRPGKIAALKEKKEKAQAEFSKRVMELDEKINSLLAIAA